MQLLMRGAQPHSPVLYHSWMFAQMQVTPPPSPPSFAHTRVRSCVSLPVVRVTIVRVCHYRLCVLPSPQNPPQPHPTHNPHTPRFGCRAGRTGSPTGWKESCSWPPTLSSPPASTTADGGGCTGTGRAAHGPALPTAGRPGRRPLP